MRFLLPLLFAGACLAQDRSALRITVIAADGTESTETITGAPAAAGLQVLSQYMATQQACDLDGDGNKINCRPKYRTTAAFIRYLVIREAEEHSPKFPSSQLKPLIDDLKAREAAIETARKALFDAAKAQ